MYASKNIWVCKFKIKVNFYTLHRTTHTYKQCHRIKCFIQVKMFRKMSLCPRLRASNLRNFGFGPGSAYDSVNVCLSVSRCFIQRKAQKGENSLTSPMRYGLPASPSRWLTKICRAMAVDCRLGVTTYWNKAQPTGGGTSTHRTPGVPSCFQNIPETSTEQLLLISNIIFAHISYSNTVYNFGDRKVILSKRVHCMFLLRKKKTFKKGRHGRKEQ